MLPEVAEELCLEYVRMAVVANAKFVPPASNDMGFRCLGRTAAVTAATREHHLCRQRSANVQSHAQHKPSSWTESTAQRPVVSALASCEGDEGDYARCDALSSRTEAGIALHFASRHRDNIGVIAAGPKRELGLTRTTMSRGVDA